MTKRILSFISGGLISLIVIVSIIGIIGFFWFLHIGYEPILESRDYFKVFGFIAFLGLLVFIPYRFLRKRIPKFSNGLLIGFIPILFILVFNSIDYYKFLTPTDFDRNTWIKSNPKPYEMSRSLIRKELTKDLSKSKVLELLGKDYIKEYSDDSTIVYPLDISRIAYFRIQFDKKGITKKTDYIYYD